MIDFSGQAAIVTGAGRGLGRLYALELARRGARVVVNDLGGAAAGGGIDPSVADQVVDEITEAGGVAVTSHHSVASPEGGAAIVQTALDAFDRVDAVVSNAGIFAGVAFDEMTVAEWRDMLAVHLDGAFYLAQPAFRAMKEQGYGRFVFIASNLGAFGQDRSAHYASAKAGIIGLTNEVANAGAPHGIRANSVLPMGVTRLVTNAVDATERVPELESFYARMLPEWVVPIVAYLASRECDVTHHNFSAGAGRYARVFTGLTQGWLADTEGPFATADDIAAHLPEIVATDDFTVPMSSLEEIAGLLPRLGLGADTT